MSRRRCFVFYVNLGDAPVGEEIAVNLVIDDSGSMSGEKIAAVRAAFAELVRALPASCQLGLICFGSSVRLFSRPTEHREFLLDQLGLFEGGSGGTALLDAIAEGCRAFDEDGRKHYVLALTDGGECASEKVKSVDDLVRIALESGSRVSCLGFGGDVDRNQLEQIAHRTGGEYFSADQVEDLSKRLREALAGILTDRSRVLLRPEVTSLLGESAGEVPAWWSQFSIDEWDDATTWFDDTHIRYPRQADEDPAQATAYTSIVEPLTRILEREIERPGRGGKRGFDPDADLVVIGWLHDPAFRVLSLRIVELFRDVQRRLAASLPGDAYPLLVPLVRRLASRPAVSRSAMAAWYLAAHTAAQRRPLKVLEIDDSNHHRAQNPHGHVGLSESGMVCQVGTLLRALAFDPDGVRQLASRTPPAAAGAEVSSAGALSLVMPRPRFGLRREAASALREAVAGFTSAPARAVLDTDLGKRTLTAADVEPDRMRGRLLAPSDRAYSASQLAELQISLQDFWPPPATEDENDYLRRLPRDIEEKGTYKIARRLEILLRLLEKRSRELTEGAGERVDRLLDELLIGSASQGTEAALRLLGQCHQVLVDWRHSIGDDLASQLRTDLDRLLVFAHDERAFRGVGPPSFEEAMERLTEEIEDRPSGVAFFLRHALLSVALGGLAHQATPWITHSTSPVWVGPVVCLAAGGVSWIRWRHVRQRLVRAIKEACSALSRSAWELAKDHVLHRMRDVLERMRAWIGNPQEPREASPPAWVFDETLPKPQGWTKGQGFDEVVATRHQLVDGLKTYLRRAAESLEAATPSAASSPNPFVWELGSSVANPTGTPPRIQLPPPPGADAERAEWRELARPELVSLWREVVRRRHFDELDDFLQYHRERLELPERLLRETASQLAATHEAAASISAALASLSGPERGAVVEAMRMSGFPAFFSEVLGDRGPSPAEWRVLANGKEIAAVRSMAPDAVPIEPVGEIHLLATLSARIDASHTWSVCGAAWKETSALEQEQLLASHGQGPWLDPWRAPVLGDAPGGTSMPGAPNEADV